MTVGEFALKCLRAAGDITDMKITMDSVLSYLTSAVYNIAGAFRLDAVVRVVSTEDAQLFFDTGDRISPFRVFVDGVRCYDWYETNGGVMLEAPINFGIEVAIHGDMKGQKYTYAERDYRMVYRAELGIGEVFWVPPQLEEAVRYDVMHKLSEETGQFDKAMYYGKMAQDAIKAASKSLRHSTTGQGDDVVRVSYPFDE